MYYLKGDFLQEAGTMGASLLGLFIQTAIQEKRDSFCMPFGEIIKEEPEFALEGLAILLDTLMDLEQDGFIKFAIDMDKTVYVAFTDKLKEMIVDSEGKEILKDMSPCEGYEKAYGKPDNVINLFMKK